MHSSLITSWIRSGRPRLFYGLQAAGAVTRMACSPDSVIISTMQQLPVVMTFSGHDPCGGAGLQADIETLASQGCRAAPVVTALTVQDSTDVMEFRPLQASQVISQARAVLEDMPVAAFKIGMTGSVEVASAIHSILRDYPDVPLVLDPVLATGNRTALGEDGLADALRNLLLPMTTVLTPNSLEARALAPAADTLDACAIALLDSGAEYVLLTGTHEPTPHVTNTLYHGNQRIESFSWDRLPHDYHGSGCTLAACTAGLLAHGLDVLQSVHEAQHFTWQALAHADRPGMGQYLPDRLFWARQDQE